MTKKVELTDDEKKAAATRKRKATRAANEAKRAEEERKAKLDALVNEEQRIQDRLPQLQGDYAELLERLGREKGFDRHKWNKLDQLQSGLLNSTARLRRIRTDLESYATG